MRGKLVLLFTLLLTAGNIFGQDAAKQLYDAALEKAQAGDLDKALQLLDSSIALKSDEYGSWYNRGIVKTMMGHYEDAKRDLEQTLRLNPTYKKGYFNLARCERHLTDYNAALTNYTMALALDSSYADAYYERGSLYELLGDRPSACIDFAFAKDLGSKNAIGKTEKCKQQNSDENIHSIVGLKTESIDFRYGHSSDKPVKVGTGPDGGPANERAYLDLLRTHEGQPIKYTRISSCCAYKSIHAPRGLAMLDKYEIQYPNEKGEIVTDIVYITFYDYEEPEILFGFKTVKPSVR